MLKEATFENHRFLSVPHCTTDDQADTFRTYQANEIRNSAQADPTSAISQFTRSKSLGAKKNSGNVETSTFPESLPEVPTRFELVIRVLQTHALPLGYGTIV